MLFKTATCPNCRNAEAGLRANGISYEPMFAEENQETIEHYGIMQAPTLVIDDGLSTTIIPGAPRIIEWAERNRKR